MKPLLAIAASVAVAAAGTFGSAPSTTLACTYNFGRCSGGNCYVNVGTCTNGGSCTVSVGRCDGESDLVAL